MAFQTEFQFTLPKGYVDKDGNLHREGVMRLVTAKDEIAPLQDYRVQANRAYLVIILLSRVIVKLGSLRMITPNHIEDSSAPTWPIFRNSIARSTKKAVLPSRSHARPANMNLKSIWGQAWGGTKLPPG